jgi:hypothetical protein
MTNLSKTKHIENIREIANTSNILLIDAVHHYTEFNGLDPYFIADVIQNDKAFLSEINKDARKLNLLK